jgi:hypothetical protein
VIKYPKKIRAKDADVQTVQDNMVEALINIIEQQILDGVTLESVAVATTPTPVEHKLGRVPVGYVIISKSGPGDVYDIGRDSNLITLQSTVDVTTKLWVF